MKNKAGLYIHIPFCKSKCPYCDFYSVKYDESLAEKYTDELIKTMGDYTGEFAYGVLWRRNSVNIRL